MDGSVRRKMESAIGGTFGDVRLHTGSRATAATRSVDVRAFTLGNHVAVVPGVSAPIGSTMKASINTIGTMYNATLEWLSGDLEAASAQARAMHEYLEEEYGEPGEFTLEYIVEPTEAATSAVGTGIESVGDALDYVNPL